MSEPATITFVIPTLNASRYLAYCLSSIRRQEYDQDLIEILVADGGSTDDTRDVATSFGAKVIDNPGRTAEAGKAIAARVAGNDLLAFVDSDNELPIPDWIERMVQPFADPDIVSSEVLYWDLESPRLSLVDRYCALTGVNDPLCLFLGNYGRYSYLTGKWTGLRLPVTDRGGYLAVSLPAASPLPTMGANGFMIRRPILLGALRGDKLFDIDLVHDLAQAGDVVVARVPVSVTHFYASGWRDYRKKARRRTHDFFFYSHAGDRTYPWRSLGLRGVVTFCLSTVLVVPTLVQAARGYARRPDRAWFFHPVACMVTLAVYAQETVRALFGRRRLYDRTTWLQ